MSRELRKIALEMVSRAHDQRNKAEWRLWAARDEVTRLRMLFLEAQASESIAQRDFDRAQEFLNTIWSDARPMTQEVGPDSHSESASDVAALGPNPETVPR